MKRKKNTGQKQYLEHKEAARRLVHERLQHFNVYYNFEYNTVSIKNVKTRWGSCSSKRNLNFNYRIIFLRGELQDYIIVHELCHLREMNHAKAFWDLVAQQLPNWQELKDELQKIVLK